MNYILSTNVFVYTRTLNKDYEFHILPKSIEIFSNQIHKSFHKNYDVSKTNNWVRDDSLSLNIIWRCIIDGKIDNCGRKIKRFEGIILPKTYNINFQELEEYLCFLQLTTNNYSYEYGFNYNILEQDKPENPILEDKCYIAPNGTLWPDQDSFDNYVKQYGLS